MVLNVDAQPKSPTEWGRLEPTAISTSLGREKRLQEVVEETAGGTKKAIKMSVAPIDIPFVDND